MKVYFTDKQVPEMSGLALSQRSIVRDGAFDLFCREQPSARWWVRLGNGGAVGIGLLCALTVSHQIWIQVLVLTVVMPLILLLVQSFLTERLRPYFRQYIDQHRDEISRAA